MGATSINTKPEAESFSYAYVEDADGKLVRVAVENMKAVLGIAASVSVEITLYADAWTISSDETYYTQIVNIDGVTINSRVDLTPTPAQIIQLMNEEVSMFLANEDGVITAYCINGTPSTTMTISAIISEVG